MLERLRVQLATMRPSSSEPAVTAANGIEVGCAPCSLLLKCFLVFKCIHVLGTSMLFPQYGSLPALMCPGKQRAS